ncbi:AAA family ATPase [Vulcanisaeta distributa]|uniref:ATPase n=1 Tax=Vulcanisaeta distributa (strain DSM 14429 / JCM 11212 / NBRC 100878 / IC-017) TaxID=572478 RepID=E1QRA7_VULDI|nr:ATP-binding protein [Vulcanisaeta distributa]ADN50604.1 ATPase [Vulcanisaeta distributa DSM 14429]
MLFDPKPKERREDLFDRDEELRRLRLGLSYPVTLLLGIRRSGKSSLIKVLMNEEKDVIWVYLDLRKYEGHAYLTYRHLLGEFERALNSWQESLRRLLQGIRGVSISGPGFEVRLGWGKSKVELGDLFDRLSDIGEREGRKVVIVFDEAQELRKLKGFNILYPLAYAYDNLRLNFVFTGSQIGMVYRFLRLRDPGSPLFGRAMFEVRINPFTREQAVEFLRAGFREVSLSVSEGILEDAYNELGGVPGWLTYYGLNYMQLNDHGEAIRRTLEYAVQLIRQEFENFLRGREEARERYYAIMSLCRFGCRWSDVKRMLMAKEGYEVDDKKVTELLQNLMDASFLIKENDLYKPSDPLIARAF